ncbi:MAG: hypothetical protein NTV22_04885 [bacterium]|nr:hypothetical protein [bacterium]
MNDFVPSEWLLDCVDMQEIESTWIGKPGPYGISREGWDKLKAQMEDGDVIWSFESPQDSWLHSAGRMGYALVRSGRAIDGIVTLMN